MRKTLISALTAALIAGAVETTFAAANPFEDVPRNHWAYDAVSQLAVDGVVEGYGDGTYRGGQEITRYEMAQMVARAMTKNPVGADKALVEKLAAEFVDELASLGVRVAALEKRIDNVKWNGMVRYRYINRHEEGVSDRNADGAHFNTNQILLRFEPQMTINNNWTGRARIGYGMITADNFNTAANNNDVMVDRLWVEGKYENVMLRLGKFNVPTAADYGITMDDHLSGAEAVIGKTVKVALRGGRLNLTNASAFAHGGYIGSPTPDRNADGTATYYGLEVFGDRAQKFTWGLGWQHVSSDKNKELLGAGTDNIDIFNFGLGWKFDKNVSVTGAYAFATGIDDATKAENGGAARNYDADKYTNSAMIQLNYKGARKENPGSWGAFAAYRHLGDFSTIHPTYREIGAMNGGEKGWEIGVSYTFAKNIIGLAQYTKGKEIASGHKVNAVWTQLGFYF